MRKIILGNLVSNIIWMVVATVGAIGFVLFTEKGEKK